MITQGVGTTRGLVAPLPWAGLLLPALGRRVVANALRGNGTEAHSLQESAFHLRPSVAKLCCQPDSSADLGMTKYRRAAGGYDHLDVRHFYFPARGVLALDFQVLG